MTESPTQCVLDANATRYLNGIGLVIVLYDHFITLDDEVRLVWQAKRSFAKYLFLVNRYLVPLVLIWVAIFMNNFSENSLVTTHNCRRFYVFSSLFGVISVGIANVLVLLRVINLWERNRRIACFMFFGFIASFCATFTLMTIMLIKLLPGLLYFPAVHMCVATQPVAEIKAVWASPMLFEVIVLILVCLNAFDRPRVTDCEVKRGLVRDGVGFFAALTVLRIFNLLLATVVRPSLIVLGVFFVWAMTTLVLSRALFSILRMADQNQANSIFGLSPSDSLSRRPLQRAAMPAWTLYPSIDKGLISPRESIELR